MADTAIEWTDKVWNPVTGCSKVSQGCKNCYAERVFPRAYGTDRKFTDVRCHEDRLDQPLHWKKPARIFVNSMSDLFHEDVPEEFIGHVFAVMAQCPQHTFQILTKRPHEMLDVLGRAETAWGPLEAWPLPNVWLGVSVEDQKTADERIPLLLQTPAAVRWISAEPLLGPIDLSKLVVMVNDDGFCTICDGELETHPHSCLTESAQYLDWVVVGGESGPGARPMHPAWARSVRDQCKAAGVPFFFKQWGEWMPMELGDCSHPSSDGVDCTECGRDDKIWRCNLCGHICGHLHSKDGGDTFDFERVGKKAAGRLLDGVEWDQYPR